jgi:hypothetical protein
MYRKKRFAGLKYDCYNAMLLYWQRDSIGHYTGDLPRTTVAIL